MALEETKNPVEAESLVPPVRDLPIEEPEEGVFYAYANLVNMNWTQTDVRIRFGELLQVPDEDNPTWDHQRGILLERASITIPWIQAKVLRDMLDGVIRNYETLNGELRQAKLPAAPGTP
jgi:Protein of unknown function (DUF3467)